MPRIRSIALLALAVLWLSACAPPDEPAAPPEATPTPELTPTPEPTPTQPEDQLVLSCTNPDGFSVSYPDGWVTNDEPENALPPCSLFDPASVDTGEAMEVPETIAVFIHIDEVAFENVTVGGVGEDELDREDLTIDGREAVRAEVESTGEGLREEGLRTTRYVIDVGDGRTFFAETHDTGDVDYDEKQDVLDAMIDTLSLET